MSKRKEVVFISGKYTGKTEEETKKNIEHAVRMACRIAEMGYTYICPHLNSGSVKLFYNDWIEFYLVLLERCDKICMLSNWESSNGARIEYDRANELGMEILYEENLL